LKTELSLPVPEVNNEMFERVLAVNKAATSEVRVVTGTVIA